MKGVFQKKNVAVGEFFSDWTVNIDLLVFNWIYSFINSFSNKSNLIQITILNLNVIVQCFKKY